MAEFRFIMRQRRRMCDAADRKCGGCALQGMDCGISAMSSNPDEYEDLILQWAAEHPEPDYPSFMDWLRKMYPQLEGMSDFDAIWFLLETKIPADIAQKLGLDREVG